LHHEKDTTTAWAPGSWTW